jgi:hypothetical protein
VEQEARQAGAGRSFEIGRYGLMTDKSEQPDKVEAQRHYNSLKGFKVFEMDGPLPSQWKLIATRTTDYKHPDAPVGQQQGSGSLDAPEYYGGKYMILSAAPDDSYGLTEYPNYLYSPGYQVWDMSDPADPKFVSQISVPGQILGNEAHEQAYMTNPRAGNRTSWMGRVFLSSCRSRWSKVARSASARWADSGSIPSICRIQPNRRCSAT